MSEEGSVFQKEQQILTGVGREAASGSQDIQAILHDLKGVYRYLKKYGSEPSAVVSIMGILKRLRDRDFLISQKIDHVGLISRKLANFDVSLFPNLQALFNAQTGRRQAMLREHIMREHRKFHGRYDVNALVESAKVHALQFQKALVNAILSIGDTDSTRAEEWILKAIYVEKKIAGVAAKICNLERKLLRITDGNLRAFVKLEVSQS